MLFERGMVVNVDAQLFGIMPRGEASTVEWLVAPAPGSRWQADGRASGLAPSCPAPRFVEIYGRGPSFPAIPAWRTAHFVAPYKTQLLRSFVLRIICSCQVLDNAVSRMAQGAESQVYERCRLYTVYSSEAHEHFICQVESLGVEHLNDNIDII